MKHQRSYQVLSGKWQSLVTEKFAPAEVQKLHDLVSKDRENHRNVQEKIRQKHSFSVKLPRENTTETYIFVVQEQRIHVKLTRENARKTQLL